MPYKIIVADPSPSVQKAVQLAFAEPEFRVSVFEDGASLLESVAGLRPDALRRQPDAARAGTATTSAGP